MKKSKVSALMLLIASILLSSCSKSEERGLNPKNPVVISFFAYYNDVQTKELIKIVEKFNSTRGKEIGVVVDHIAVPSAYGANKYIVDAAVKAAGSGEFPDVFIAYKGVIPKLYGKKEVINYKDYLSEEEMGEFVEKILREGYLLGNEDNLSMLPVGSSTEIMFINKTDYEEFAKIYGFTLEDLKHYDKVLEIAEAYYEYTDAMTPDVDGDGKALLGFDSKINHIFTTMSSLGYELMEQRNGRYKLNFNEEIAGKIWDYYIAPALKGHVRRQGRFVSEDLKAGRLVLAIGSTAGSVYMSDVVIDEKTNDRREVEIATMHSPYIEGTEPKVVLQGGGVFVTKGDKLKETASVEFLRWLLNKENNTEFAFRCSYMPVRKDNTDVEFIKEKAAETGVEDRVLSAILTSIDQTNSFELYRRPYFEEYEDVKDILINVMDERIRKLRNNILELAADGGDYEELVNEAVSEKGFNDWYQYTSNMVRTK